MDEFLFNKVRAVKNAADEGSPGIFIFIFFRFFLPKTSIKF